MKTYKDFLEPLQEVYTDAEAAKIAPGVSPEKRRAALERAARRDAMKNTPETPADRVRRAPQKALPSGRGGEIQKRPSSSMTTQPKGGALAKRPAGGALDKRPAGGALTKTDTPKPKPKPKTQDNNKNPFPKPRLPRLIDPTTIKRNLDRLGRVAKGLAKTNTKRSVGVATSGNLEGPGRGIYNP